MSRSALLLFALILSAGAVASSSAQGSCGDWLAHSDDTVLGDTPQTMAAPHTDIDTGIDDGTRWQVTDESHARDSQPRPCRGLHCDQAPWKPAHDRSSSQSLASKSFLLTSLMFVRYACLLACLSSRRFRCIEDVLIPGDRARNDLVQSR